MRTCADAVTISAQDTVARPSSDRDVLLREVGEVNEPDGDSEPDKAEKRPPQDLGARAMPGEAGPRTAGIERGKTQMRGGLGGARVMAS